MELKCDGGGYVEGELDVKTTPIVGWAYAGVNTGAGDNSLSGGEGVGVWWKEAGS